MATNSLGDALRRYCRQVQPDAQATDGELLGRYHQYHDEAAFRELVDRHGGLVWGVAVRRAADRHAAEDAFQATFLALAQRASRLSCDTCIAGWLHTVAARTAARTLRRPTPASLSTDPSTTSPDPLDVLSAREVLTMIDDEITRLPDRYRLPVLLCGLDGLSREEAASRLGWPAGAVKGRLERGRELLRRRLERRGVALGVGLLVGGQALPEGLAAAAVACVREPVAAVAALATTTGGTVKWLVGLAAALLLATGLIGVGLAATKPEVMPEVVFDVPAKTPAVNPDANPVLTGTITNEDGNPISGATVVAIGDMGNGGKLTVKTDSDGRFQFNEMPKWKDNDQHVIIIAGKNGFAPSLNYTGKGAKDFTLKLPLAGQYAGVIQDVDGKPVKGASVQFGPVVQVNNYQTWQLITAETIKDTPVEQFYFTTTDADGKFNLNYVPADGAIVLRVIAKGYGELDTSNGGRNLNAHIVKPNAVPAKLVLQPETVIRGNVTSKVKDVVLSDLRVFVQGVQSPIGLFRRIKVDAKGNYVVTGLPAGQFSVYLDIPEKVPGTAVGQLLKAEAGETLTVDLTVIPGVLVTGMVQAKEGGKPLADAALGAGGDIRPKVGQISRSITDKKGQFTFRLPPGKAYVYVQVPPAGYGVPGQIGAGKNVRDFVIPEGVDKYTLSEPFELIQVVKGLNGQVVDAAGKVMPHVKVLALQHTSVCGNFFTEPMTTSADGQFTLNYSPQGPLAPGTSVPLRIVTDTGKMFESNALVPADGGVAVVKLPTLPDVEGPKDVKPNELAGVVVDINGKPLAGVKAHVWDWVDMPDNYSITGPDGVFRIKDCDPKEYVEVRYKKDGYAPVLVTRQPIGVKGLVVVLDQSTYFEGVVKGPDGKPVAGAVIRADQGPKILDGRICNQIWTETTADINGRYKLMVCPDNYEFHVKATGVGVARLAKTGIGHGQKKTLDINLAQGITFRAKVIDSVTGKPVAGLRLYDWSNKTVDGTSAADGTITITDMLPGEFSFNVKSDQYTRWWNDQSPYEHERKSIDDPTLKWQRNFDRLTFDLKLNMAPVTITAERGVLVTGRVLDPDGKPVGGATVAPALTGTGNSLTGDTRFSVESKPDGTFAVTLPASGAAKYNLMVHDGKYEEWRNWANGVLPVIKTTPGQVIENVTLTLTKPAVVRGKVVDAAGKPLAGQEVRTQAADNMENRYYNPTVKTAADGTFELKYVRPTAQLVQVDPYWLNAEEAPKGTSKVITLKPGQVVAGITLVAVPDRKK